jgi:TonB family protein
MPRWLFTVVILLHVVSAGFAQLSGNGDPKYDLKKCKPKLLSEKPVRQPKLFQIRRGDKPTGYSPLVALEILESGAVVNVHLARSSGVPDQDAYALESVRGWKFNSRPGCGTVESKMDITIDLR